MDDPQELKDKTSPISGQNPAAKQMGNSPVSAEQNCKSSYLTRYLCAIIACLVISIALLFLNWSTNLNGSPWLSLGRRNPLMDGQTRGLMSASSEQHHMQHRQYPSMYDMEDYPDHNQDAGNFLPRSRLITNEFFGRPGRQRHPGEICVTPGCIRAAAQILNNMDNSTKPCEDFYQFACGRWIETEIIPDERTSLSVFSITSTDLNVKLRALIERQTSERDPPIVNQMRNLYYSCMNLSDIEARGDGPLLDSLSEFGGWPVLMKTNTSTSARSVRTTESKFDWLETLAKFRDQGFSHDMIIDLSVVPDVRNSRRFIVELDQSSLGLPDRSYYFRGMNDSTVAAYYSLMVDSAVMLGADRAEARVQMAQAFEFETSLAKISIPREQRRNTTRLYNKMLAKELSELAPGIDWQRYLKLLVRDEQFNMEKDMVIVKVPAFIKALNVLLAQTEPKVIANYMIWRIVRHSMAALSRRWRELAHGYSVITTGRQAEEPRWERCLGSLEGTFGIALSALFVKNNFNKESKASALEMVDYIRNEFLNILDEIDWMDDETRREAKLKAKAISPFVGYPDELLQDNLVEDFYQDLRMVRNNFYQNMRNLRIWSTNYAFGQLRRLNKRGDWKKHARAAVVNAYYNSLENSIEFPAGILQGSFFDAERPNYMNFGAIGFVIGHEITHGFDDRGRQFDKEGNNRNWWNAETDQKFKDRAQCIIEQYGNYSVDGLKVNGINTQGENIADNGGLKEAFRAYTEWNRRNGPEPLLPGVYLSQRQLFWVSAANVWCGKYRPEVLKMRVTAGSHSPAQFRINGPLSNLKEFSETFNCPPGSPLNPVKKCSVW